MAVMDLNQIIKNKKACFFVSPHFDDAVLSAGSLMLYLSKYTKVTVLNVFTECGKGPYTRSAIANLKQCKALSPESLYKARKLEDSKALSELKVTSVNLGFVDALYRKKTKKNSLSRIIPELIHVYPTYRYHIIKGEISRHDDDLRKSLYKYLYNLPKNSVIFSPAAIGNHVDHMLVKEVCELLPHHVVYWYDFPYPKSKNSFSRYKRVLKFGKYKDKKMRALMLYKTQVSALFPNGLRLPEEEYYIK